MSQTDQDEDYGTTGNIEEISLEGSDSTEKFLEKYKNMLSDEKNKEIREIYRNLMQNVQETTEASGGEAAMDLESLRLMLLQANNVFQKVKRPREAAMDAQFLKTIGSIAKSNIESAQSSLYQFRPVEFANNLINYMCPESDVEEGTLNSEAWTRFGKTVSCLYKQAAGVDPLYAALEYERPARAPRQPRKPEDKESVKTKPQEIEVAVTGEEKQTEEVNRIFKILNRRYTENLKRPLCFFSFAFHPKSYTYTVENLFHISFLVRDQHAEIISEHNLPVIAPRKPNTATRVGNVSNQFVLSYSKEDWRDVIKTFEITEPMIPDTKERANKRLLCPD